MWGQDVGPLLAATKDSDAAPTAAAAAAGFDVIILADLVFNHREHHNLLRTCVDCLRPLASPRVDGQEEQEPQVLVSYTSHRPWLADKDAV